MNSTDFPVTEPLDSLLEQLGIQAWDLVLIGDGSGSHWDRGCGWGCVSVERETMQRKVWYGTTNAGTVNFAEMMAYLQPLCWYVHRETQRRREGERVQVRHVHIITDSSYVARSRPTAEAMSGNNGALWQVFKQFTAEGLLLHWHWLRRESLELNQFADKLSKAARIHLESTELHNQVVVGQEAGRSIYSFNPCE